MNGFLHRGNMNQLKPMLQTVSDDISYIQSQNRGLQVQTQNQKALLTEVEQLLVSLPIPLFEFLDSY